MEAAQVSHSRHGQVSPRTSQTKADSSCYRSRCSTTPNDWQSPCRFLKQTRRSPEMLSDQNPRIRTGGTCSRAGTAAVSPWLLRVRLTGTVNLELRRIERHALDDPLLYLPTPEVLLDLLELLFAHAQFEQPLQPSFV